MHRLKFRDRVVEFEDAKRALRWAVGSQEGPRSSTWRVWANKKGDIYLSTRSMGGILKASFHRDRRCHVGFTSEYADTARSRFSNVGSRHWEEWTIPDRPLVRAAQVVIPSSELRPFRAKEARQMRWLPAPANRSVSVVSIFIAKPGVEAQWPGSAHGALPLGLILTSDRTTWLVHVISLIDDPTVNWIEEHRAKVASLPGADEAPRKPGVRAVLWGTRQEEHEKFFLELAWS